MKFDFLINIIFSHEYYNECIPSEIFEIEPRRTNRVVNILLGKRVEINMH